MYTCYIGVVIPVGIGREGRPMKCKDPRKLALRIIGFILFTIGNLITATLGFDEFRYIPELFARMPTYRAMALTFRLTGAIYYSSALWVK